MMIIGRFELISFLLTVLAIQVQARGVLQDDFVDNDLDSNRVFELEDNLPLNREPEQLDYESSPSDLLSPSLELDDLEEDNIDGGTRDFESRTSLDDRASLRTRCGFGARLVYINGRARCRCPRRVCPAVFQPICGTDNLTYRNRCSMEVARCSHKKDVSVLHSGSCLVFHRR